MERIPKQGEFYRHFKNKLYQIVAVAEHTESGEQLVVYQALYGDFKIYARPLPMFISPVDRDKYPEAAQEYRFERVELKVDGHDTDGTGKDAAVILEPSDDTKESESEFREELQEQNQPNPYLLQFLEAEGYEKQMEALAHMKGHVGQEELDSLCVVLDIPLGGRAVSPSRDNTADGGADTDGTSDDNIEEQLAGIVRHLTTRNKYDGSRLR